MKSVSVHIVTYNSVSHIESCLEAVFAQSYPIARVVIVDNNSSDGTKEKLGAYESRVDVVYNDRNTGFAAAHNLAIKCSESQYCLILNPDVILHPDYIYKLITWAESGKVERLGSMTGKLLLQADHDIVDSCGLTINKARRAFDLGNGQLSSLWTEGRKVFGVSGAAAMYSREMIDDISLDGEFFDETFFAYKEDVDVSWRAQLLDWNSCFIPEAIAFHERGWKSGGRRKQSLFVRRLSYINRYRMIYKNDSVSAVMRHFWNLLVYEIAAAAFIILREPKLLMAWKSFFQDRKKMQAWRREIRKRSRNNRDVLTFFNN